MVESLISLSRTIMLLVLSLFVAPAIAEVLGDPTRPPSFSNTGGGQYALFDAETLQSVIISAKRRAAVINGETIEIGGRFGDARLVEVNEGGVVLQSATGRRVLKLFPGVEIKRAGKMASQPTRQPAYSMPQSQGE